MTREQVKLFITKTPTHYRDLNLGPLVRSLVLRPLDQPAVKFKIVCKKVWCRVVSGTK
jgi:hypothetical protein